MEDHFIAKLKKELKQPIQFESDDDMETGFAISYDSGKSSFDFTDKSLAKYLSQYLNARVAELVKEAAGD